MSTYNFKSILEEFEQQNQANSVNNIPPSMRNQPTENNNKLDRSGFVIPKEDVETVDGFDGKDIALSSVSGVAEVGTFILDIPSLISKGLDFVKENTSNKLAYLAVREAKELLGASDAEMVEFENNAKKILEFEKKKSKKINDTMAIGSKIEDKFSNSYPFNYESKTNTGRYIKTGLEFALPSAILAPTGFGVPMALTGFGSGIVAEGAKDVSNSEMAGTGVGVAVNIAADLALLKKGNASGIAKRITDTFTKKELDDASKLQKKAKADGIDLKVSDVLEGSVINKVEQDVMATTIGSQIIDKFWKGRPDQLKNYIRKWAKESGLIKNQKVLSEAEQFNNLKNVAIALQSNRAFLWEKSGGTKIKNFQFGSQEVDNLVISIKEIIKNSKDKTLNNSLNKTINLLKSSDGKGGKLHEIYREVRDMGFDLSKNINKTIDQKDQMLAFQKIGKELENLMLTNPNFKKAQDAYKNFTKAYLVEGVDKLKLFKDIKSAKNEIYSNQELTGKIYKFFNSDKVTAVDIKKMAEAFNESTKIRPGMLAAEKAKVTKNQNAWRDILSGYFETAFLQAHTKGMEKGISDGAAIYKALMNNKVKRNNFAEALFQLAKQNDSTIQRIDIQKSVDSFATILKGTGNKTAMGSNTFDKFSGSTEMGSNIVTTALGQKGGIPFSEMISNFFFSNAKSKSSEKLAKALVSPNGVDELIKLSKGWKDPDNARMFIVNILKLDTADEEVMN